MDRRNCDVTQKIFYVLNDVKGFEVAMGNPRTGRLILNYNGTNFTVELDPMFTDTAIGNAMDKKPFTEIVSHYEYLLK